MRIVYKFSNGFKVEIVINYTVKSQFNNIKLYYLWKKTRGEGSRSENDHDYFYIDDISGTEGEQNLNKLNHWNRAVATVSKWAKVKKENRNDYIIHGNMRKKVEKRERSDHDSLPNK